MKKNQKNQSVTLAPGVRFAILLGLIGAVFGGLFWDGSKAQDSAATENKKLPSTANISDAEYSRLYNIAVEKGSAAVVIELEFDYQPEGAAVNASVTAQRDRIKREQRSLLEKLGGGELRNVVQFETIPALAALVGAAALERLRTLPEVRSVSEDSMLEPTLAESAAVVRAPQAWAAGFSGQGQVVAVLDTGVDKNHSFLTGKIVSEACYSTTNPAQSVTSVCPGGAEQSTEPNSGLHCSFSGCEHGTHVAGIAAGRGTSFSGVARDADLAAIQVFSRASNGALAAFNRDIIRGLERTLLLKQGGMNVAAANMSLGSAAGYTANCNALSPPMTTAINNLRTAGVATVVSSGNGFFTNRISFPACISTAVSVGFTYDENFGGGDFLDVVADDSNSASFLNLLAPGGAINSSIPGNGFANLFGTSMAAPHVAGAWAIMKQRAPNLAVTQALNLLTATGRPIIDDRNGVVKPRLDIENAISDNPVLCQPAAIKFNQRANDALASADCQTNSRFADRYSFNGTAGQQIIISLTSDSFNTYLYLLDASGQIVAENGGGGGINSRIPATSGAFTLPSSGTFTIRVTSAAAGETGNYTLTLNGASLATCPPLAIPLNLTFNRALTGADCQLDDRNADLYKFNGTAGQQIVITMNSSSFNTYLYLLDASGQVVAENNDAGGGTNSRIPANGLFTLPSSGVFTIRATSAAAGETGNYNLKVTTANCLPTAISFGQTVNGTLTASSCLVAGAYYTDFYTFSGTAGQSIVIAMNSTAVNAYLILYGPDGQFLAFDDNGGGGGTNARIPANKGGFILPAAGTYTVEASTNDAEETGAYTLSLTDTQARRPPFDFDGDGKADVSVFRPENGTWYLNQSASGFAGVQFGVNTDKIVPADYDGDGKTDVAVFRSGIWYIQRSQSGFTGVAFGESTDIPVPADYDGDGKADVAVFRPSIGTWYLRRSSLGFTGIAFGQTGDKPVAADYDGDGKSDIAVYRNGTWYLQRSQLGFAGIAFGTGEDKPVPADYDGDGKADVAVFRPSNGTWYLQRSTAGFAGIAFGLGTDLPAAADYDGDGKTDVAVFRPENGTWYLQRSQSGFAGTAFGAANDKPIPNAFVP